MSTLFDRTIAQSYTELLKTASTSGVTSSLTVVEDGDATASALQISTTTVKSSGSLEVVGSTTLASTLSVTGISTLTGNVSMGGDLLVAGNAVIQGTLTANGGTLTLGDANTDNVVFNADINSHILPNTDNTYDLGSAAKSWRDLHIDGTATFNNLSITGSQTVSATTQSTDKDTGALVVEGGVGVEKNVNVGGNLAVTGTTALTGNTSVTGTLGVTGATNLSSTLGVTGATTLSSTVGVSGATTLSSTLGVTGATTLSNTLGVSGATTLSSTLGVTGATTLSSTLGVSGATTLSSTLGVTGAATLSSTLGVSDTISATLASGTGLAVTANATIGGTLGVTGNSTFGTITAGTWQGTIINPTYGGTGVNNGSKTITLGGDLTTSGAFATTLASTANTNVTLPTTGTLATLANTETFTNKTLTSPVISSIVNTGTLTLPTSTDTLVGRATTDTLTNKTLTSPVISSISNTGTLTLPTSTDTLVGRATTDTLTNKSIDLTNNTLTATSLQIATAVTDETGSGSLVFATSPTLTTPSISQIVNTGTLSLPTSTDTLVGRATTDTLTNKTISLTSNTLTATSAELATAISDETGTGSLVFANSPTLVTPTLGAASATSLSLGTPLSPANGGTGLSTTSAAAAGKILGVAPSGSAHEYKTLTPGTGISITDAAGIVTITNTGSGSGGGGGGSASGAVAIYRYNATAAQTVFSGVDTSTPPTTLVYTPNYLSVFLNGVKLDDSDFTATNGTSVTLSTACVLNDDVDIVAFGSVPQLANPGLANYVVGTTAGGTALEYKQIVAGTGVSIAQGVGSLTISAGGSPLSAPLATFRYIASSNQTVFTGLDSNGNPLGFTPGFLYVFVNGVLLAPSLDYTTTSSTTITLTSGCSLSDFVDILAFGQVTTVGLTDSSVTTAKINDSAVTTAKINNSAVTTAKLDQTAGSEAVTTATIRDGAVTAAKLAAGAAVPSQTGNSGKYLTTNGTTAAWQTSPVGFRNRIINGDMRIDQRNAGASVTINNSPKTYTVDRWQANAQPSDGVFTVQQSSTAPAGFTNSVILTVTTADSSITTGQFYLFCQRIEGYNVADFDFGKATAKTITISFWVSSSITGQFGGAIQNSATNRSYPFTYSIISANTFEYKTITIAGDTSGTWLTDNGIGLFLWLDLGCGTTARATAGSWASGTYYGATGDTDWISTLGATFYITGVQLEQGSTATEFERRPYGTELALCQRYLQTWGGNSLYERVAFGYAVSATQVEVFLPRFSVPMRTAPSLNANSPSNFRVSDPAGSTVLTSISISQSAPNSCGIIATVASGLTTYRAMSLDTNNTLSALLSLGAEL